MISWTSSKMGHVGSKTRSLGQILEKPSVRSRGHIFSWILMKVGQDVCLDDISDKIENGSPHFQSETLVSWSECLS